MSIQTKWPLSLTTPLGTDVLLPKNLSVSEGVSQMFHLRLETVSAHADQVVFENILGKPVNIELKLPGGSSSRYWNGIVNRITQGDRTDESTAFTLEIVPKLWLLTRVARSRIFQQKSAPDIIKELLTGLDVSYEIQGTFQPRNYCVQYRETDFNFVSRLMEDEGIFYFFKHASGSHQMVVGNKSSSHPDMAQSSLIYDEVRGGSRPESRVIHWQKSQEIRTGKFTLWDYNFELQDDHLEAVKQAQDS